MSVLPFALTVMMYHYVRDPGDRCAGRTGIPGFGVAQFEAQLDALSQQFTPIAWPDLRAHLLAGRPLPEAACLLTFDDGLLDHYYTVFPILRARGLSGLFFALARPDPPALTLAHKIHFLLPVLGAAGLREALWSQLTPDQRERFRLAEARYRSKYDSGTPAGAIDLLKAVLQRDLSAEVDTLLSGLFEKWVGSEAETAGAYYLSRPQIEAMRAGGMHFGGHSRSHPWFDWIGPAALADEIAASAGWLPEVEAGPWAFAYPYGGLNPAAPALLQAHGFAAAFTTREQIQHMEPFYIGRFDGEEWPAVAPARMDRHDH